MLSILAAILVFGLIVLIHELGHFLLAKFNGIGVVEFSIGMGPRLLSKVWGDTRYSLKVLPFGGSCMMLGEDENETDERAFNNKSVLARISVLAAGPIFNFILAFIFAIVIVSYVGHDEPILIGVVEGYPAAEAGLQPGDRITKVNSRKVQAYRDLSLYLMSHPGEAVKMTYERPVAEGSTQTETRQTVLVPQYSEEHQAYMVGVTFQGYRQVNSLPKLLSASVYEVKYCIVSTFDSFRMIFSRQIDVDDAVAGPVRIVTMVGETVTEGSKNGGFGTVLYILSYWCLVLSASLGIMNLLPIPALDGGRLVFLFVELIRGKPIDPDKEGMIHMAGMMVLMALMVFILFNDVRNLF